MSYRIAGIIKNDFAAAPGVCVTVFVQGCPLHCPGCHNPELQPFDGGRELNTEEFNNILKALTSNDIHRDLCIMGGEPLCAENALTTAYIAHQIKKYLPDTKVYIWSGYTYEELQNCSVKVLEALRMADYLIDGPYVEQERDVSLFMRGSRNQRIIDLRTGKDVTSDFEKKETT